MEKKKVLLVYHKEDNDGVFSAALVLWHLFHTKQLNIRYEDVDLLGTEYVELENKWKSGEVVKWKDKYDNVIMTDVSFNTWKAMKQLYLDFGSNFIWIDHHRPKIKDSFKHRYDVTSGLRDTHKSAILLAYQYFIDPLNEKFDKGTNPQVLGALSAYDCWNWDGLGYDGEECKTINVAVNVLIKLDIVKALGIINNIMNDYGDRTDQDRNYYDEYLRRGYEYRKYQKYEWENLMKIADKNWKVIDKKNGITRTAAAVFYQGPTNSMMFDSIKDEVECGIVIKPDTVTGRVVVSLYNTKDGYSEEFDCGDFANRIYRGGGHQGASGFNISLTKLNKLIKTKTL